MRIKQIFRFVGTIIIINQNKIIEAINKYTNTPVASQIEVTKGAEALAGSSPALFKINGKLIPIRQPISTIPIILSAKTKATKHQKY